MAIPAQPTTSSVPSNETAVPVAWTLPYIEKTFDVIRDPSVDS